MTERTATTLLLVARDPVSGRLRRPSLLDTGLRAALLGDLMLIGRVTSDGLAPFVTDAPPTGDRILDTLSDSIARREGVSWRRWYTHVRVDRDALTAELVANGRWRAGGTRRQPAYLDTESDATLQTAEHIRAVLDGRGTARDGQDALLAVVAALCGALDGQPRYRTFRRELRPLLNAVPDGDVRQMIQNSLVGAIIALRRRHHRWLKD